MPLTIDPQPTFSLSPWLYMQFMEPLGVTDSSVEASWDHINDDWRPDLVAETKKLGPTLLRWGGCLSSYYRWHEGVGPRNKRKPYYNLLWGGIESNQVGTHEFCDFAQRVGATPFFCVNFESDGRKHWAKKRKWGVRSAGPKEAAQWVDYCNNPSNKERKRNGAKKPFNLKLWQLGNETSYDKHGFDCETTARKTITFAKTLRKVDPDLKFIGWGDSGWAPKMIERTGEHIDYIAYHMGYRSTKKNAPFRDDEYQNDPSKTWDHLMTGVDWAAKRLKEMRQQTDGTGIPLALTESHYGGCGGRNRGNVFGTWAMGVAYARILNHYQRNGDVLKIATLADFAGTRWMNNAILMTSPGKVSYMLPVAHIMSLYRHHTGKKALCITKTPADLDVFASRTGDTVYLHAANINRTRPVRTAIEIPGARIVSGKVSEIAVPPELETYSFNKEEFEPKEKRLPKDRVWRFPAASVSAMELKIK